MDPDEPPPPTEPCLYLGDRRRTPSCVPCRELHECEMTGTDVRPAVECRRCPHRVPLSEFDPEKHGRT